MRNHLFSLLTAIFLVVSCQWVDAQTYLLNENFDGITSGVPSGWDDTDFDCSSSYRWKSDAGGYGGTRGLRFNTYSASNGTYSAVKTPVLNLNQAYILRFKYKNYNAGQLDVYISFDGGATYTTVLGQNLSTPDDANWQDAEYSLSQYIGQSNVRIVFKGISNYGSYRQYLDNVSVESAPTCKSPTGLFVSNLTTTSATLNWGLTVDGDVPGFFTLTVQDENGSTVLTDNNVPGTSINYSLTGLSPNTTYTVSMRGDCSGTYSGMSQYGTMTFTTACNTMSVPYTENFDELTGIPDCTVSLNASIETGTKYGTSGKSLKLSATASENAFMIFPSLNHAANDIEMGFFTKSSISTPITFMVGIVSDPADIEGTFEPLYIDSIPNNTTWHEIRMNTSMASVATSPVQMCVFIGSGKAGSLYLDDVSIHAIPSCVRPEQFRAFNPTSTSIDLTWTTSLAQNHIIDIMDSEGTTSQVVATTNPYTVTGLQPNSQYSFRLRAYCAVGDTSEYASATVTATTLCAPLTVATWTEGAEMTAGSALPDCWTYGWFNRPTSGTSYDQPFQTQISNVHSGTRSFQLRDMTSGAVSYLTSPGFTIDQPNVYQASIWVYRPSGTSSVGEGLHLFASNSPDNIIGAQDLGFINRCAGNSPVEVLESGTYGGWFKYSFPIAKTGVVYLIIQGESKYGSATNFDDVAVELAPTCLVPGDIFLGAPTMTDNTISWTAGASGETSWILVYDLKVGNTVVASDSLQVSSPTYTFTNLSAATTYSVNARVYAVCSPTDMSEPKKFHGSFSTPCGVITAFPYVQDFEEGIVPPNCWTNQVVATSTSGGSANAWQSSSTYKHGGTYSAYIPDKQAGAKTALISGELNLTDTNGYQVSFWMYRQSTSYQSKTDEAIHVYVSPTDSLDETTAVELGVVNAHYLNAPAEAASGWYQYTFDIPTSVTGSQYVSFCYHNQYGSGSYIDDVMIRPAPTCRDMAAPQIIDIQPTSAIVMINDTSAHTWDISYGPAGTAAGAGTIITVTDTNAYTLTGLTPSTNYDVYIRRNCGTEFGMWTTEPVSFTAICTPATATVTDAGAYDVTLQANANEWEISWGTQGTTAATGTIVPVSGTNTYTLTGLTPATDYVFYVRHNCSGVYSDWSSAINVKTTIVPDSIPFSTGFEDDTDNNQWTIANGSNLTNHFVFGTDANAVASGSKALYIANNTGGTYGYSTTSSTKTFAYRTIYFGSGVHNVTFRFKCTGGESTWDFASIMLVPASETLAGSTGSSVSSTTWPNFTEVFSPVEGQNHFNLMSGDANGWNTYTTDIDMTGREGTYNFVVMWSNDGSAGTSNYPISIDNLSISQVTCNTPAVLSGSTTSTGTTISVGSQTATQWEVAVSTTPIDVFGTVTGDVYQQVTSAPVVLTGLTANTAYYYTARAICAPGDTSNWADAQIVRTACDAYETPYNEAFEDAGALNCWPSFGNAQPSRNTSYHFAGTASMKVNDAAAVSPTLNVTTLAESMLNGWAYSTTDSTVFSVGIMVDPEDMGTFEVLGSVTIPAKNTWTEFTTYFNALEDPDYEDFYNAQHFVIVAGADATIYVDNLYLGDIPTCPKPTETTITNVLANTFTIGWTENGTATSWRVRAIPAAGGTTIDTVVTTNPANIAGLNAASAYDVEILAICSATDTSLVTNCGRIRTTCDVVNTPYEENFELMTVQTIPDCWDNSGSTTTTATSTPYYVWGVYAQGGNQMIRMYNYLVSSGYTEIKSPVIAIGATGATLYFDLCHQASSGNMDVHISSDGGANWTSIGSYAKTNTSTDNSTPQGWVNEQIDLTAYANQNVIIRFSNQANYGSGAIFVDNVTVRANLACATPTDLTTVTPATAHDVQLSWTAGGSETEWQVRIQNAAGTTYQTVNTNPCTITGLNAASNFNISIAAICGVGDTSYFSAPIAITTACDVVAAPINETFDAMPNNSIPNCWDNSESTTSTATSTPYYVWGVYAYDGNQMLRMHNYLVSSGTAEIVTSAYDLSGSVNGYVLKFDYCHQASCGAFDVEISNDYGANWNTIGSYTSNSSSTSYTAPGDWTTVTYPLSNYNGDTILLRFFANANYGSGAIFVDNFRLLEARSCADPVGVSVNPSDTFAVVTINDPAAGHTQWQYVVVAAGADTTGIAPLLVDTNAFTINGLTGSSSYDIYVRAYCDPVEQSNWLIKSFQTTTSPASFPYICQFTDSAENAQWRAVINSATANRFCIGSDAAALSPGNTSALYVTDQYYSGYGYGTSNSSSTAAYRLFRFEPSQYALSFSWKCTGGEGSYDYARFYLVPAVDPIYLPSTGSYSSAGWPTDMIALDGGGKVNLVTSPEWNNVSMTLDMTSRPGSYYLVFVWSNDGSVGTQYPLAINDIEISELTCFSPANISIPDSTITVSSAVVNYDDPNGAGTTVRWWINTTGIKSDTLQSGVVTASPFTISNLTSATKYYLIMQTECSETDKSPLASTSFRAGCDVITTFPFTEDFEDTEFPAPCWENISLTSGDYYGDDYPGIWYRYSTTYTSSYMNGYGCAKLDGATYASAILSTPPIQFLADREYHMSFYMYRTTTSYYTDYVKVYLSDSPTSIAGATLLNHTVCYDPQTLSSGPVQISFDLPSGVSGNKYIVFYGMYDNYGYVYIDDINIDVYPTCRDLNTVAVDATTATTMTVSADKSIHHQGVIFAYAPATAASVADTIGSVYSTTGTAVITGLTPATTYMVYARGVCSETDSTTWTAAVNGTTMASDCFEPQNLHIVGMINATDVTLAWGGAPEALDYAYQCVGTSISGTVANDTIVLTGLTPRTGYNFRVRTNCLNDTSAWVNISFTTPTMSASLPYYCDFEDAVEANMWELNEGTGGYTQTNEFIVGSATSNSGSTSLYISNDGSSNDYTISSASVSFATRTFQLPAGQYAYSYDWSANGESTYDYGRAFLAPEALNLVPGTTPTGVSTSGVPSGGFALDGNTMLNQGTGWQTASGIVTIPVDGYYNMVFMWRNDGSVGSTPPLAIDNVQFAALTCPAPTVSVIGSSITETTASFVVENNNDSKTFVYAVSTGSVYDAFLTDTVAGDGTDTIALTGLAGSSNYKVYVKVLCSETDESFYVSANIRTACGVSALPYSQGFEEVSGTYSGMGMIESICWNDLNASSASSSYPYYKASTTYVSEGSNSLQLVSSNTNDLYLILPSFGDVSNCRMTFDCAYESFTSSGTIYVGYLTNPSSANSFVTVYTASSPSGTTYQMDSHVTDIAGMPAGSRLAFKYADAGSSNYWAWLDNIRVFQLVQGPTYQDTICNGQPYTNYGFNVPANSIQVGDNTFSRTKTGVAGNPDTVITANVYMYPTFDEMIYDTTCAGQPYNGHGFTIAAPTNRTYQKSAGLSTAGCDSTVMLVLTVVPTYHEVYDTICEGNSYVFGGQTLTTAGDYTNVGTSQYGCNDTTMLHLYVVPTQFSTTETICKGTSFTWHGQNYTTSGTYTWNGTGAHGCTTTETLYLTVTDGDSTANVTICQGGQYLFVDTMITTAGTYYRSYFDATIGCQITITLNATVASVVPAEFYDDACEGIPYSNYGFSGLNITKDTMITRSMKTVDLCDSVINVHLTYHATTYSDTTVHINEGDYFTWHDNTYSTAGDYPVTLQSIYGCDSIVTLHLIVGQGVETVADVNMSVVPNPVNAGATAFVYGEFGEVEKVEILSNFGQIVETFVPDTYPIEVSGISASGIYYVRVTTKSGSVHLQKLIVK